MVIVENRDFIKKALIENGLNLYDFHDGMRALTLKDFSILSLARRMDVLLIDTESVLSDPKLFEMCKPVMNTFQAAYFFHTKDNQKARQWVEDQASFMPKIVGECALPLTALEWTLLSNQLQFFWTLLQEQRMLQKHMAEFSQELDQAMETAQWEVTRVKRLHETLLPKRTDEIKGVRFYTKYASGEGSAAEFTDLHHVGNKVYQIIVSSESYLISSSLLGILNTHKATEFNVKNFLADVAKDIAAINSSKRKKAKVAVSVIELDVNNLELKSYGHQDLICVSTVEGEVDLQDSMNYQLKKGEKFVVFSPGFLFNWNESNPDVELVTFVKNHGASTPQEIMMELFFRIRENQEGQFLKKDATVLVMEVNRHGIHTV